MEYVGPRSHVGQNIVTYSDVEQTIIATAANEGQYLKLKLGKQTNII